ncbi:MAG: DUF104 domain-containing protein [Caldilineaceae bacterium]|nr:DUF104 domain-containing protein [Caldilineaceae bacterium]
MLNTVWATVRDGKIEPLEPLKLEEGTRLLVTLVEDAEINFWLQASQSALDEIWDNEEDESWHEFLQSMYGIFRDEPLERAPQGTLETREELE